MGADSISSTLPVAHKAHLQGQGLVEFIVALPILLLLLVGLVETVALANDYLRLQATVREGARFGSHAAVPATAAGAAQIRKLVLSQLEDKKMARLDADQDIVVIFASLNAQGGQRIKRVQYPPSSTTCPSDLTAAELLSRAGRRPDSTALVAVEVCFNHSQLLGLPVVSDFLPDPIPLHLHIVMPRTRP